MEELIILIGGLSIYKQILAIALITLGVETFCIILTGVSPLSLLDGLALIPGKIGKLPLSIVVVIVLIVIATTGVVVESYSLNTYLETAIVIVAGGIISLSMCNFLAYCMPAEYSGAVSRNDVVDVNKVSDLATVVESANKSGSTVTARFTDSTGVVHFVQVKVDSSVRVGEKIALVSYNEETNIYFGTT